MSTFTYPDNHYISSLRLLEIAGKMIRLQKLKKSKKGLERKKIMISRKFSKFRAEYSQFGISKRLYLSPSDE